MAAKHSRLVKMPPSARFCLYGVWALLLSFLLMGISPVALATTTNTIDGITTNVTYFNPSAFCLISNGGIVSNSGDSYIESSLNQLYSATVTGTNSAWICKGSLSVGIFNSGNSLLIANGASVSNINGVIGNNNSNNFVRVTGAGSTWVNKNDFKIGYYGNANSLMIDGGATR